MHIYLPTNCFDFLPVKNFEPVGIAAISFTSFDFYKIHILLILNVFKQETTSIVGFLEKVFFSCSDVDSHMLLLVVPGS